MKCLNHQQLLSTVEGNATAQFEAHLASCPSCRDAGILLLHNRAHTAPPDSKLLSATVDALHCELVNHRDMSDQPKVLHFPRPKRWALAAGVALAFGIGLFIGTRPVMPRRAIQQHEPPFKVYRIVDAPDRPDTNSAARPTDSTVEQVRLTDHFGPGQYNRFIHIRQRTGSLISEDAQLLVAGNKPRQAEISLQTGRALFSVEQGVYRTFYVTTPDAIIQVTGTVFEVSVENGETSVRVIEGSVDVEHRHKAHLVATLRKAQTARVNADSLIATHEGINSVLRRRNRILHSYLAALTGDRPDTSSRQAAVEPHDDIALDRAYRRLNILMLLDAQQAGEHVDSFALRHAGTVYADKARYDLARQYEESRQFTKALEQYARISTSYRTGSPYQSALFRQGKIYMEQLNNAEQAEQHFSRYLADFPNGIWAEAAAYSLILIAKGRADTDKAIASMQTYIDLFPSSERTQHVILDCAEALRNYRRDYERAIDYYELFLDKYPDSPHRERALFLAGWCLVQRGMQSADNHFFARYEKEFPAGKWQDSLQY
ncbi:MAG: tetratricopeptide repeat protein [Chitinivibrionales bacterium]|nr:tetratricopeptide repeat protein [Chitinivibrionales bacterium]